LLPKPQNPVLRFDWRIINELGRGVRRELRDF